MAFGLIALEPFVLPQWNLSLVSFLFLAGAFLWELRRRWLAIDKFPAHLDTLATLLFFAVLWFVPQFCPGFLAPLELLTLSLLILGLGWPAGLVSRLLASSPMVFLGEISFSVYLAHASVQRILKIILPVEKFADSSLGLRLIVLLAYAAAILGFSLCLHYAVERPARKWLRQFGGIAPRAA